MPSLTDSLLGTPLLTWPAMSSYCWTNLKGEGPNATGSDLQSVIWVHETCIPQLPASELRQCA